MLFGMVERGMDGEVVGDKGKLRAAAGSSSTANNGEEAIWAVVLTKELWRKGIWCVSVTVFINLVLNEASRNDAKTVSIVALGCFHPVVKVQSASLHFFLGSDEEKEDSDDEEEEVYSPRFHCNPIDSPTTRLSAAGREITSAPSGDQQEDSKRRQKATEAAQDNQIGMQTISSPF